MGNRLTMQERIEANPAVREAGYEDDGAITDSGISYWIYLKPGNMSDPECHIIHEPTMTDAYARLKEIKKCECDDCLGLSYEEKQKRQKEHTDEQLASQIYAAYYKNNPQGDARVGLWKQVIDAKKSKNSTAELLKLLKENQ